MLGNFHFPVTFRLTVRFGFFWGFFGVFGDFRPFHLTSPIRRKPFIYKGKVEAGMGIEPINGGFANHWQARNIKDYTN